MAPKSLLMPLAASLVAAVNVAPDVPVSGQIGALDFGITCNVPILGSKTFGGYSTATAPIQGTTDEEIYYDDLVTYVTIPGSLTFVGGFANATQADAIVKVGLDLDNASSASFEVFPMDTKSRTPRSHLGNQSPFACREPARLLPIGPVVLGDAGKTHLIRLGEVTIDLTVLDSEGRKPSFRSISTAQFR